MPQVAEYVQYFPKGDRGAHAARVTAVLADNKVNLAVYSQSNGGISPVNVVPFEEKEPDGGDAFCRSVPVAAAPVPAPAKPKLLSRKKAED